MAANADIRAGRAYLELIVKDSQFAKGLKQAEAKVLAFGKGLAGYATSLGAAGAAILAPLSAALWQFVDAGSKLDDMSQRTGVATDALSELGFAAEQSGANLDTVEAGLKKMQKVIGEAAAGSDTAAEALDGLGVPIEALMGLTPDKQMEALAEGLSKIQDPSLRAAAAMDVFGKSGTALLPLFADGAAGIRALRKEAQDAGLSMGEDMTKAAAAAGDAWDKAVATLKSITMQIGYALAPAVTAALTPITNFIVAVSKWAKENQTLWQTLGLLGLSLTATAAGLMGLSIAVKAVGFALGGVRTIALGFAKAIDVGMLIARGAIAGFIWVLQGIPALIAFAFSPPGLAIIGALAVVAGLIYLNRGAFQDLGAAAARTGRQIASEFNAAGRDVQEAWGGIGDAIAAGDITAAARIAALLIKLEFQRAVGLIQSLWHGAKTYFLSIWTEAVYSLAESFTWVYDTIRAGWTETVAAMKTVWVELTSFMQRTWASLQGWIGGKFLYVLQKVGVLDKDTAKGAQQILADEIAGRQKGIEDARNTANAETEAARKANREKIKQESKDKQEELERQRKKEHTDRAAAYKQAEDATQAEIDKAKAELTEAVGKAHAARLKVEEEAAKKKKQQEEEGPDLAGRKASFVGTFSGARLQGLGTGSTMERVAKASEATRENTQQIARYAKGWTGQTLVFGS